MLRIFASLLSFFLVLASVAAGTNEKGLAFLEANKNKPGVITLPSGLQYKVLKKGPGAFHPTADSSCSCHYEGTLIDGSVFDSSYQRGQPTSFAPNQVIKGWTEAMQLMVEGDKWEMYIPSELGYGDGGSPPKIGGGDVLIFQMEILDILGDKVPALQCKVAEGEQDECTERELKYIAKTKEWAPTKVASEITRVRTILGKPMADDLKDWANRRVHILQQLKDASDGGEL
ncbi:unnamed protein product [Cylindrotheca closterium]|uniref:peptidylprolyl isomerase n=1 Tax=Cylindrotheca closterium TaxID=2856 RepID=A0AAD2FP34_9STRA|nr:unnamed protein product [Cylindrotheca closterium]